MSENPGSSSASADDFIYVSMEEKAAAAALNNSLIDSLCSSKSPFSQVVFHDLSEVYPTDGDISFTYSFQSGVIPQEGDRIALYKVGWSSVSEFITSIFTDLPDESPHSSTKTCKITFSVANLPKDEVNMYQFCYITSGNIVAGSSIPFTFRKPQGSELVAVEDPNEPGLVVFRSRVTQLQERVFKVNAEKEALEKTINELKSELYLVKTDVAEKAQKCGLHKESIHDMTQIIYDLNNEKRLLMEKLEESSSLGEQVEELKNKKEALEMEMVVMQTQIEKLQHDVEAKDESMKSLNEQLMERLEESSSLGEKIEELKNKKEELEMKMVVMQTQIEKFQHDIEAKDESLKSLNENGATVNVIEIQLEELMEQKKTVEAEAVKLKCLIDAHEEDLAAKNSTISILTEGNKEYQEIIKGLKKELSEAGENFDQLEQAMKILEQKKQEKIISLTQKLREAGENFDQLEQAMNVLEREKQEKINSLSQKLREITEKNNASGVESLTLSEELKIANNKIRSLEELLKSKDVSLRELLSNNGGSSDARRLLVLQDDNSLLQAQIFSLEERVQSFEVESSKLADENHELKLEKKMMADQLSKMNEELRNLKTCSHSHYKGPPQTGPVPPPRSSNDSEQRGQNAFTQFAQFIPFFPSMPGSGSGAHINVSATTGPKSMNLPTCEKCLELEKKVQSLMLEKADIRSDLIQTKHANEEYCRHLREVNEEAAALKSRIAVLEIELRIAKEASITMQGEQKFKQIYDVFSSSVKSDISSDASLELNAEISKLKESLKKELETKALLQHNIESLMKMESNYFVTNSKQLKEIEKLKKELIELKEGSKAVDEVRRALDDMDLSHAEVTKKLQAVTAEKIKLEQQLIDLRKESVGKVSLSTLHLLRDENYELKKQLNKKECCKKLREKLGTVGEAAGLSVNRITQQSGQSSGTQAVPIDTTIPLSGGFTCPVCMLSFPPNAANAYNKHFSDHFD